MARYIDADALKREIVEFAVGISSENQDYYTGYISALSVVQGMLAYAPTLTLDNLRPKGRWEDVTCTNCGQVDFSKPNFCPSCGADMRGGEG